MSRAAAKPLDLLPLLAHNIFMRPLYNFDPDVDYSPKLVYCVVWEMEGTVYSKCFECVNEALNYYDGIGDISKFKRVYRSGNWHEVFVD